MRPTETLEFRGQCHGRTEGTKDGRVEFTDSVTDDRHIAIIQVMPFVP